VTPVKPLILLKKSGASVFLFSNEPKDSSYVVPASAGGGVGRPI
jgi:hypothetical protein